MTDEAHRPKQKGKAATFDHSCARLVYLISIVNNVYFCSRSQLKPAAYVSHLLIIPSWIHFPFVQMRTTNAYPK
jgi:hypothetical protein